MKKKPQTPPLPEKLYCPECNETVALKRMENDYHIWLACPSCGRWMKHVHTKPPILSPID